MAQAVECVSQLLSRPLSLPSETKAAARESGPTVIRKRMTAQGGAMRVPPAETKAAARESGPTVIRKRMTAQGGEDCADVTIYYVCNGIRKRVCTL